ncbi:hypothetical protein [Ruania alba]|uniref:Uncharacterized protein n=1 Tax=Ruania alba TaxID=648782 RepID=A0A1H5N564_9MICO|nr:hypothetical protein [Ruania alba]SEE96759.1 hypothetical protein SAMN04488554_3956 [Ruania alba]
MNSPEPRSSGDPTPESLPDGAVSGVGPDSPLTQSQQEIAQHVVDCLGQVRQLIEDGERDARGRLSAIVMYRSLEGVNDAPAEMHGFLQAYDGDVVEEAAVAREFLVNHSVDFSVGALITEVTMPLNGKPEHVLQFEGYSYALEDSLRFAQPFTPPRRGGFLRSARPLEFISDLVALGPVPEDLPGLPGGPKAPNLKPLNL